MTKRSKKKESQENLFEFQLRALKFEPGIRQFQFHPVRRWRFDFAWPHFRLCAEIEGGVFVHGAHTRGKHFTEDCEKYNMATLLGWQVYRFTSGMVKDGSAILLFRDAIKARKRQIEEIRQGEWI
jgi:very-short-patch-repair endonuclease